MSRPTDSKSLGFLAVALLIVLLVTLFPYELGGPGGGFQRFDWEWDPGNVFGNILLFAPLGFGLARFGRRAVPGLWFPVFLALGSGFILSISVEWIQTFLPERAPSFPDVVANTLGAVLGSIVFLRWEDPVYRGTAAVRDRLRPLGTRYLPLVILVWGLLILGSEARSRRQVTLAGWDESYPLILGNEHTADRPWNGWISELGLGAGAASSPEDLPLMGMYRFDNRGGQAIPADVLPPLAWQGTHHPTCDGVPVGAACFGPGRWLESALPPTGLTEEIIRQEGFTLVATVASADSTQGGPARLISISQDPRHRNLTLGQSGPDLIVRVRTPFTGFNGERPEMVVPGVFATREPRRLTVTYDRGVARVYVDGFEETSTLDLRYAAGLCGIVCNFREGHLFGYRVVHHLMVLVLLMLILVAALRRVGLR